MNRSAFAVTRFVRRGAVVVAAVTVLTALLDAGAAAQGNVAEELSATREKLEEEAGRVDEGEAKADRLMSEIRVLDKRLLASGRSMKALHIEEARLEKEYGERLERLETLEREREAAREKLAHRLSNIYKRGRLGSNRVFAQAATSSEPLRMARYLAAVSKADSSVFAEYDRTSKEHEAALGRLREKQAEIATKKQASKQEAIRYESARVAKTDLLVSVERDLAEHRVAAERLAAVEARLQRILAPAPDEDNDSDDATHRPRSRIARLFRGSQRPFAELEGELEAPVIGQVVRRFGEQDAEGPGAKGMVIRAAADRQVVAVAGGEVVFAGPFPGLGKTLIINHGDRYHSVYAHLGSIQPEVGERVHAQEVIGSLARADPELHFELRGGGKPLDPRSWFDGGYAAFR